MTRFARAKGSKASNERHPEEPTPWYIMKQDLENSVASKKIDEHKPKTAKELLQEKDDPYYATTTGNVSTDWAEFEKPNAKNSTKDKSEDSKDSSKKKKKNKRQSVVSPVEKDETGATGEIEKGEDNPTVCTKSRKRQSSEIISAEECNDNTNTTAEVVDSNLPVKKKKKKDKKDKTSEISSPSEVPDVSSSDNQHINSVEPEKTNDVVEKTEGSSMKLSKRQKRNRKNKIKTANGGDVAQDKVEDRSIPGAFNTDGNDWSKDVKFGDSKKIDDKSEAINPNENINENKIANENRANGVRKFDNKFNNQEMKKKRKPPKIRDDKEHKRRKPNPGSSKVIINGMEVEIVMYDGFPIRNEDAERLKDLRHQMVMKGINKKEIDIAMKLERRKAEKALTRIKKHVCFHCRKAGHNLSDCPDLNKEESATGICFKCGSTEHTHFECKVNRKAEFRFASCFICREQGHIAKQCPDNPKGLYPDGGSCNLCGDVTHLRRDCPDLAITKAENTIKLGTIVDSTLESLDDDKTKKSNDNCKQKNKIVTF